MIVEEMSGAGDSFQLEVAAGGQRGQELFERRERRDVVFGPVDEEFRFRATGDEIQIAPSAPASPMAINLSTRSSEQPTLNPTIEPNEKPATMTSRAFGWLSRR